ncbi:MAG TPA: DUF2752 domain-containing protein [Thermoanaerobaculia bacterium]|nr:DUF2752 domain-containing protein [Thermoanaerobaculia bacterium]
MLFAALAGLLLLRAWVPVEGAQASICIFRRVSGIPCPGCGMTRAFAHLAKGEWREAVVDHPLAPLLALELGLAWAIWGCALAGWVPFRLPHWFGGLLLAHVAVLAAIWLGRLSTGTLPW